MDVSMELKGAAAAARAIRRLKKEAPELVNDEVLKSGINIERGAKKRARHRVDTGRMMNSIHHETESTQSFRYTDDQGETYDGVLTGIEIDEGEVAVGSNVEYFPAHEFGSEHIRAQPMLRPAAEQEFKRLQIRLAALGQKKLEARVTNNGFSGVHL